MHAKAEIDGFVSAISTVRDGCNFTRVAILSPASRSWEAGLSVPFFPERKGQKTFLSIYFRNIYCSFINKIN